MPRTGVIKIDTTEALASTWGMSAREIGVAWLDYLSGKPSVVDDFASHKAIRPNARPRQTEWRETRQRIFARDGHRCTYCGATDQPLECDHVRPVALGGGHSDDNLTTACKPCNASKGMKTVEEFLAVNA